MTDTNLNLNINPELLTQAEEVFAGIGLSLNEAMNYFLRASVKIGRLPSGIEEELFNAETLEAMQETEDILSGKIPAKSYDTFDEFKAEIDAEIAAEKGAERTRVPH